MEAVAGAVGQAADRDVSAGRCSVSNRPPAAPTVARALDHVVGDRRTTVGPGRLPRQPDLMRTHAARSGPLPFANSSGAVGRLAAGLAAGVTCRSLSGSPQHSERAPSWRRVDRRPDLRGVADGLLCSTSAAAPATCGDAIDVPFLSIDPVSDA